MRRKHSKALRKRLDVRNHDKWAKWYVQHYGEELDKLLKERYDIELGMNEREKINFIKQILKAYWKSISTTLFSYRQELYWSRRLQERGKMELIIAFLVDKDNLAARKKYLKKNGKNQR